MRNVRVAFHSPNPEFEKVLRRLAPGLNINRYHFVPDSQNPSVNFDCNFFFGTFVGNEREIQQGLRFLRFAQENLSSLGNMIPMAVAMDHKGYEVWKSAGLKPESTRLVVWIGDPSTCPNTNRLACAGAKRVHVHSYSSWTEDELDRVRIGLHAAVNPFNWGGI